MGDIYRLFRLFGKLPGTRLKLAALYGLHVTGRRYLGVFLDPVLACNFRCRMCYFSDEAYRREARGVMSMDDYRRVAGALFRRTLKLQLGCGAEPTLYKELGELVRLAKRDAMPRGQMWAIRVAAFLVAILIGAVIFDVTKNELRREQIAARAREVIDRNIATVQEIACRLGEQMADTELLLRSIADDYADDQDLIDEPKAPENGRS